MDRARHSPAPDAAAPPALGVHGRALSCEYQKSPEAIYDGRLCVFVEALQGPVREWPWVQPAGGRAKTGSALEGPDSRVVNPLGVGGRLSLIAVG